MELVERHPKPTSALARRSATNRAEDWAPCPQMAIPRRAARFRSGHGLARLHHEPHAYSRNLPVIAITVWCRGLEADGISWRQQMFVEPQRQVQPSANQIGVLSSAVSHQLAVRGGGAPRPVGNKQEIDVVMRHLAEAFPSDT